MTIALVEVTKELSKRKADQFHELLFQMVDVVNHLDSARRQTQNEEYAMLSLTQLQMTLGISRIAAVTATYEECLRDEKLNTKTWLAVEFN